MRTNCSPARTQSIVQSVAVSPIATECLAPQCASVIIPSKVCVWMGEEALNWLDFPPPEAAPATAPRVASSKAKAQAIAQSNAIVTIQKPAFIGERGLTEE